MKIDCAHLCWLLNSSMWILRANIGIIKYHVAQSTIHLELITRAPATPVPIKALSSASLVDSTKSPCSFPLDTQEGEIIKAGDRCGAGTRHRPDVCCRGDTLPTVRIGHPDSLAYPSGRV